MYIQVENEVCFIQRLVVLYLTQTATGCTISYTDKFNEIVSLCVVIFRTKQYQNGRLMLNNELGCRVCFAYSK